MPSNSGSFYVLRGLTWWPKKQLLYMCSYIQSYKTLNEFFEKRTSFKFRLKLVLMENGNLGLTSS